MNYKVLYRKYRPDTFENIIGQDYIITTLKNSIKNNAISHAYIFSGPRGTGKTTTAKVFAKAINCLNPENGSPCGKCEFCLNFKENPDIIEIDAASNRGVNEIRLLIDNVKLTPTNGKYRVYIIDEVHMLTKEAFNALLLTLEEPPSHSVFILATTNVENVPITILSRCQRFDFQKIKVNDIVTALSKICNEEKILIDEDALTEIAYLAEGGMRDALSLLDQLSKNGEKITLELIESEIKTVSLKTITDLLDYIENESVDKFLDLLNELKNRGVDYKSLIKKIIEISSKRACTIKKTGNIKRLNFDDYRNIILQLSDTLSKINVNVDSYTILEMDLLQYFNLNNTTVPENNQNNQDKTDNNLKSKSNISTSKKQDENLVNESINKQDITDNFVNIRINNCFVDAQKTYLEKAKKEIDKYKDSINLDGKIKAIIQDSNVVVASSKYLIFTCNNSHNVDLANKMLTDIENSLKDEIDVEYKIIFLKNERWQQEKEQYIKNLKENKKYEYIEEEKNDKIKEEKISINDVFDASKVEIV